MPAAMGSGERYVAGRDGAVSLASSAPSSGSYAGIVDAMGPWEFMRPLDSADTQPYYAWGWCPQPFAVTASAPGEQSATVLITRDMFDPSVTLWAETLGSAGLFGQYWAPPATGSPHAAVLEFGGSDGGLSGALVSGLLAAYFPTLIHGVVASVPSDVSKCSSPGCPGPAWTLHGRPLPFTRQFDNPYPTDNPGAVIPVERIQGPILLDCAGADLVWSSCPYAQAIIKRLRQYGAAGRATLGAYPSAGHKIGALVPYQPTIGAPLYDAPVAGANSDANALALAQLCDVPHFSIAFWPPFLGVRTLLGGLVFRGQSDVGVVRQRLLRSVPSGR
ncbi:MAG: acyl-CoA thioester hydrolase/BAAT C-terminal domain-containing protein [Mycobacteriales bacterium]